MFRSRLAALATSLTLVASVGCSLTGESDPVHFYVLTSQAENSDRPTASRGSLSIGVGPVTLPAYLDRPQIVTRVSENELEIDEFNRWAEPIEEGVVRLIGENLMVSMDAEILEYPWYSTRAPDFAVSIEVARFELTGAGTAALACRWEIRRPESGERLFFRESIISRPSDTTGTSGSVAALSGVIDELSQQVATELRRYATGSR